MLLKYWCLKDAVEKEYANGMVAWIDFGFNHGDSCYINPDEFDFMWKTKLSDNKIHLFTLKEIESQKPVFELIRTLEDNIMGCLFILPSKLCVELWNLIKNSMMSLIDVGFIDDDQLLLQMAYNSKKEIFEPHISDWFLPLKENGGIHLTVKEKKNQKLKIVTRLKLKLVKECEFMRYMKRIKKLYKRGE